LLCYEISDRDGIDKAEKGLHETENYLKKYQGLVGLHASFTVGNETLNKAVKLARKYNSGIHIHVAEDNYDQLQCKTEYKLTVVDRLFNAGVLDFSKSILAHCLFLDKDEKQKIAESFSWLVQNMESNLNNRVGCFNGSDMGNRIMLGTDGMHSDMLQSARSVFLSGDGHEYNSPTETYNRFRNVHNYIKENMFSGDGENNLVVLNYDSPTEINESNFWGHFVYGINSAHVEHVISNGNLIVKDKIIVNVNEEEILKFCRKEGKKLWEKMSNC
jgi:cytosine/adenosine deaminase-related metal-dependent hydrolase